MQMSQGRVYIMQTFLKNSMIWLHEIVENYDAETERRVASQPRCADGRAGGGRSGRALTPRVLCGAILGRELGQRRAAGEALRKRLPPRRRPSSLR